VLLHSIFTAGLDAATLLAGRILAHGGYSKDRQTLQATAGFLLIAGFVCRGVAIYRTGGVPLL
jgi:hypothetical protein